jgi:hypothetical protein
VPAQFALQEGFPGAPEPIAGAQPNEMKHFVQEDPREFRRLAGQLRTQHNLALA